MNTRKMIAIGALVISCVGSIAPMRALAARVKDCVDLGGDMFVDEVLHPCDSITSENGRLRLTYQGDNHLVLYDTSTDPWTPLWARGAVDDNPGYFVIWQPTFTEGNLNVVNGSGQIDWFNTPDYYQDGFLRLVAQNDGNLVVYRDGSPVWASDTFF